ncbi:MAG: alpha/beta hydrolase [Ilumatobacteraceae bacterium]
MSRAKTPHRLVRLVTAMVTSFTIVNGWRPVSRRGGRRSIPLFVDGLLGSEAPLVVASVHLVAFGRLARRARGVARGLFVMVGLTGVAVSIENYRRARATEKSLPEQVRAELGARTTTSIDPTTSIGGVTPRSHHTPWFLLHRSYTSPSTRGIRFGEHGRFNTLDVWRRPDVPGRTPVLVQIHGGGWSVGDNRTQGVPLLAHLAEAGWTCVAPRYRLSPRATWPDHLDDVRRALDWVRANIESHGGDPSFIALTGGSAGAHLAALAGLTSDDPVQAVVPFYGTYDWIDPNDENNPAVRHLLENHVVKRSIRNSSDVFRQGSPIEHVSPSAPPFFVLHGTNDSLLHVEPAREFVDRLRAVSQQPVVYAELPLAQHSFDLFRTPRSRGACEAVEVFLGHMYRISTTEDR